MRAVLALVTAAIVLVFVGGMGFIACRAFDAHGASIVFGYVLYAALAVTFASLGTALVVGLWHLYLYLFTDKKPLSLFATTAKHDDPDRRD